MEIIKKYRQQIYFHLLLNIIFVIFITFASYYYTPLNSGNDYLTYFAHLIILQFSVFGFLYVLSINKFIFYTVFPIFYFSTSLFAYWVYSQDISITEAIMQSVIETKVDIAVDLISLPFLIYIALTLISLYYILKKYRKLKISQLKSPLLIISIIGIATFFIVEKMRFGTLKNRLPYSLIVGVSNYYQKDDFKINSINQELIAETNNINVVFVLGESVRADHLQLNNYYRKTTPKLIDEKNIISFSKIYTPLTYTAVSVPQILTNKSIESNSEDEKIYSIYAVLNKINTNTTWIGNQSPEKSYVSFINENKNKILVDKFHSVLSFNKKSDAALLPYFKEVIKDTIPQFTTLHMIGSHWWYESRYNEEFRKFKPVIKSKHIPSNTDEEMINSYDNTILFLDSFISDIINTVKKSERNTLLIYLSDHGELLGENGKWLHAQEDGASENPAMFIWYSDQLNNSYPELIEALKENSLKNIPTDFFYHSILDLNKVQNIDYKKEKSIFNIDNEY
jgi:glucan phosphoethanolaminetransferase (alkaline phosphatase superfamily)